MALQKAVFEPENLKLHLCNGVFEAYSASYLTTKQHMLEGNVRTSVNAFNILLVHCYASTKQWSTVTAAVYADYYA